MAPKKRSRQLTREDILAQLEVPTATGTVPDQRTKPPVRKGQAIDGLPRMGADLRSFGAELKRGTEQLTRVRRAAEQVTCMGRPVRRLAAQLDRDRSAIQRIAQGAAEQLERWDKAVLRGGTAVPHPAFRTLDRDIELPEIVPFSDLIRDVIRKEIADAIAGSRAELTKEPTPQRAETDWRDVQRRLLHLYERGDIYTTISNLAERFECCGATIVKAIKDSTKLRGWQARGLEARRSPRASSLTQAHLDRTAQSREIYPSNTVEGVETDDDDVILSRLLQEAETPEERARLKSLSPEQQTVLADLLRNDPDRGDRILGRRP